MMVIDDVMPVLWTKDHGDHMFAEKLGSFLFALVTPALALLLDLPNADRHLGRAQVCDRNGLENGFANRHHAGSLIIRAFPDKIDHILSWLGMRRIRIE